MAPRWARLVSRLVESVGRHDGRRFGIGNDALTVAIKVHEAPCRYGDTTIVPTLTA